MSKGWVPRHHYKRVARERAAVARAAGTYKGPSPTHDVYCGLVKITNTKTGEVRQEHQPSQYKTKARVVKNAFDELRFLADKRVNNEWDSDCVKQLAALVTRLQFCGQSNEQIQEILEPYGFRSLNAIYKGVT